MKSVATLNSKKSRIQSQIVDFLNNDDGHGLLIVPTGVGKTKIAIDFLIQKPDSRVLWVVPTTKLRDVTIPEEFDKWGQKDFFDNNVKTICYKSFKNETDHYDHIVLDEGHNITALCMESETLKQRKYGGILLMTATLPAGEEKRQIIRDLYLPMIFSMDLNKAVKLGLVAPFSIKVYPVEMSNKRDFHVKTQTKSYTVSEKERYASISNKIYKYNPGSAPKQLYLLRMHSIYRFKSKVRAAKYLLDRIPEDKRVLIFCGSIDVVQQLCEYQFHSKTNDKHYKMFNNKEINRLAVVKSLNEGHNMVDVDIALIVQVDSNKRNYIQRQGRAIRWREGHKAHVMILYSKSTVDYRWVRKSLHGIDNKYITHINKPINI